MLATPLFLPVLPPPMVALPRILFALVMVYATWNPDGWSYWHWALAPVFGDAAPGQPEGWSTFGPVKAIAGLLLLVAWIVTLTATRRSLGVAGAVLVAALAGAVLWLLIDWHVVSARRTTGIARAALIILGIVLGVGMSWSHVKRRVTGQVATDEV